MTDKKTIIKKIILIIVFCLFVAASIFGGIKLYYFIKNKAKTAIYDTCQGKCFNSDKADSSYQGKPIPKAYCVTKTEAACHLTDLIGECTSIKDDKDQRGVYWAALKNGTILEDIGFCDINPSVKKDPPTSGNYEFTKITNTCQKDQDCTNDLPFCKAMKELGSKQKCCCRGGICRPSQIIHQGIPACKVV